MDKKSSDPIKKDVTLLLTIFNRRKFTLRWIKFIEQFNCPFNIYICDGGNDKLLQKKLEKIAKKNKKITYKKFTYYKNYKKLHEKYYLATKEIKTKYTYICEDDDFLIFENIKKSAKFLNKNKSYTCSGGQSYNIEILQNNFLFARKEYSGNSFTENSKFKRILKVLNNIQSNWNCLHRTAHLNKIFKLIDKINFKNYLETELLFILSSFYFGKINRFNHIEYIRIDNTEHSSSYNFSKKNNYLNIISSRNYSQENYAFINFFKKKFSKEKIETIEKVLNNFLTIANTERIDQIYPSNKEKLNKFFRFVIKYILLKLNLFFLVKKLFIRIFFTKIKDVNLFVKDKDIPIHPYNQYFDIKVNFNSKKNINFFNKLILFLDKN